MIGPHKAPAAAALTLFQTAGVRRLVHRELSHLAVQVVAKQEALVAARQESHRALAGACGVWAAFNM